jgi:simple sugar transport system permease protein
MRLEPIANPSSARTFGLPAAALGFTVVVASVLALVAGADPFATLGLIVKGAAGSKFALLETLNRATPLIFTGLAVAVAFRARLWNIGAEAQLYAGAVVTVLLGTGALPLPSALLIPVIALAAALAGASSSSARCCSRPGSASTRSSPRFCSTSSCSCSSPGFSKGR